MTHPLREIVARSIAKERSDDLDQLPKNKTEWTRGQGMFGGRFRDVNEPTQDDYMDQADAAIRAVLTFEPTENSWAGLARDMMMWLDMCGAGEKTPRNLFEHLERLGRDVPQWLRDEPEMKNLDHVPSKGTRVVIIYRAMTAALLKEVEDDR